MMADEAFGPTFWNLDGCNMDWDFAFSFHRTKEGWEEQQRDYEEFSRKCDQRDEQQRRREQGYINGTVPLDDYLDHEARVWQSSGSNLAATDEMLPWQASRMILFGIGCHLAELCAHLASNDADRDRAMSLRSAFVELRRAVEQGAAWQTISETSGFGGELQGLAESRTDLADRCRDLARHVARLAQRCREYQERPREVHPFDDDEVPF
jgi:hypothetical protein